MKPILFSTEMVKAILDGRKSMTRRIIKPQPVSEATHFARIIETVDFGVEARFGSNSSPAVCDRKLPYDIGDVLWVRETWADLRGMGFGNDPVTDKPWNFAYAADCPKGSESDRARIDYGVKWRPSIHMPREAARIFLRVTDVRAERLQEITEEDAQLEGISRLFDYLPKQEFEDWARRVGEPTPQSEQPFTNYLWHGLFGQYGLGNKQSDAWPYQYSSYESAIGSFSSLWESINTERGFGWDMNPWVWAISFERCEPPKEACP
jgi:hypothetical protein